MKVSGGVGGVELIAWSNSITAYDQAHLTCYARLLDGRAAGASDEELCRSVLRIEPSASGKAILDSHLQRAEWMTREGYKQLLKS